MIFNYFVVPDVITKEECEKLISVLRYNVKDSCVAKPNHNPNISGTINRGIRNSKSCFVDYGTFLDPILRKIQIAFREVAFSFYRFPICYMEDFSYTEYEENMYYDWHADSGMEPTDIDRDLSASLILSDPKDYEGGRLTIQLTGTSKEMRNGVITKINNIKEYSINECQGMMIVFPSLLLHKVPPIKKGTRRSLVMWGSR